MDELTLKIGPPQPSNFLGGLLFLVTALVNGKALADVLDVDEFFKSFLLLDTLAEQTPGGTMMVNAPNLPLFNCTCGVFSCGGFYVDVTVTPDALIWEDVYFLTLKRKEPPPLFTCAFSWANVYEVASQLIATIYTAQAQSPNGEVRFGDTGVEMTERLPFYLERLEAISTMTTRNPADKQETSIDANGCN